MARVVTVSPGPLIRVEGQPVSIRCDVKEYGGPREQVSHLYLRKEPLDCLLNRQRTHDKILSQYNIIATISRQKILGDCNWDELSLSFP